MLGPVAAMFSILLVATGIAKVRRPLDTSRAIRSLGLPVPMQTGRLIGLGEVAVGCFVLISGIAESFLIQGLVYLIFLVWVATALVRDAPLETCGCLGRDDTPPYWGHMVVNSLAVIASLGMVPMSPWSVSDGNPPTVAVILSIALLGAFLAWLILGDAARLHGMVRG